MTNRYLTSGKFEIQDFRGHVLNDKFFLKKIFEADFIKAAKNKAMAYMKRIMTRKHGPQAKLVQKTDIVVKKIWPNSH